MVGTVASAAAQLLGFFPAISEGLTATDTDVVNIDVVDHATDTLAPAGMCPKMTQQCNKASNTTGWLQHLAAFNATQQALASAWGVPVSQIPDVNDLYDNFISRENHNLSMPQGVTPAVWASIKVCAYTLWIAFG